ncbi:MAG: Nuclease (SNase domain protein) [Parcubacteria group bacterium GW2011_GWC1_42_11]|uniref:Nuclease (SNase domain protein) n=1 Tax=Candidatus Nomurabacteria bacterium GW2011_GWC2_42_20 TaxID=1618756 RepID=A0A0G1CEH3_9BACT|nr:MAG: Nuclease (SNase domain protein) [Parcubacteria group bacterium GW2011_GWC1_42_11]KKS48048.1 MAG: Nuclease (SNase domain protein) [Candidatus Nomurabacteria bacterium GW2011_GWC2_42_20]KKS59182.1 MAG: Nuclease (SNase domain protein) [Candidatus Nomurabacteria bacterium GW2011_GWA2_42_41]KKT09587.1 MAG: Nuclease (SNase domain protein) [Candidatus Nomurabacteria bacterium GW2011_GWB1_43_20]TAN35505.1 MAG: hypothetical protein EPN27_03725 [Patescibacteria group bacterium]HBH71378.1 hypothe
MTSIQKIVEKIKGINVRKQVNLRIIPDDVFLGLILILIAFASFGLGRLSKIEGSKTPVRFENITEATKETSYQKALAGGQAASIINSAGDQLVGSKNGTKYYYPWCTGVQKIAQANIIHFTSKTEAEARGYTPSATCKGL